MLSSSKSHIHTHAFNEMFSLWRRARMCVFYFTCRRTLFAFCLWRSGALSAAESRQGALLLLFIMCVRARSLRCHLQRDTLQKEDVSRYVRVCVCVCCVSVALFAAHSSLVESGEKAKLAVLVLGTGFFGQPDDAKTTTASAFEKISLHTCNKIYILFGMQI